MKKHTHKDIKQVNLFILDKSGSMQSIKEATISGFNEYISKLKSDKVKVDFNFVLFDDDCTEERYVMTPLTKVQPLNVETFQPHGMTPLYDAAINAIEKLEKKLDTLTEQTVVSVVIMTDGQENRSIEHNQICLRDLIERLQGKGNWTFAYMGANQDSYLVANNIGILRGNTMNWNSTDHGAKWAFKDLARSASKQYNNIVMMASAGADISTLHSNDYFSNDKGGVK